MIPLESSTFNPVFVAAGFNAPHQLPAKADVLPDLPCVRTVVSEEEIEGFVDKLQEVSLPSVTSQ